MVQLDDRSIVLRAYKKMLHKLQKGHDIDLKRVKEAFKFACEAHEGVRRKSGEPYIVHPMAVAGIVGEMGLDTTSVVCALLHDVVEDTDYELYDIEQRFGRVSRNIIDGLTKISGVVIDEAASIQAENFRKVLLTISDDIRVVLIKIADRLHNMRTLGSMKQEKKLKIASETLFLYAPLAHRFGLHSIKVELENLSLKYSDPKTYEEIEGKLQAFKAESEAAIHEFQAQLKEIAEELSIDFTIKSRFKSVYSVYKKMKRKSLPFEEIFDLYAFRIIIDMGENDHAEQEARARKKEIAACWSLYSAITQVFLPNPKRLRDWITVPKANGYESLHVTVISPKGKAVEIQIRTNRMDEVAERGLAAHWRYKEDGVPHDERFSDWIAHIREILESDLEALEAVDQVKMNLRLEEVYVFTPKGDLIHLPAGSSVLDLAYKIHTNIGHTAIGAKVNQEVVTLDYRLNTGDQVEVLTSQKQRPSKEWLDFIHTTRAYERIRDDLKRQKREIIKKGEKIFRWGAEREAEGGKLKRHIDIDKLNDQHPVTQEMLAYFRKPSLEEFFYALGSHKIELQKLQKYIQFKREGKEIEITSPNDEHRLAVKNEDGEQTVLDMDQLVVSGKHNIDSYSVGTCCQPIPGDDILGIYDPESANIVIHRTSCNKAIKLMASFGSNIIKAKWDEDEQEVEFLAAIKVVGLDRQGMLIDLIKIISKDMKLNMRTLTIDSVDGMFEGVFKLYVGNKEELQALLNKMSSLPHIYTATRVDAG